MFDDDMLHKRFYKLDEVANLLGTDVNKIADEIDAGKITGALIVVSNDLLNRGEEPVIDPTRHRKMPHFINQGDIIELLSIGRCDRDKVYKKAKKGEYGFYGIETLVEEGICYVFEKPFDAVWHISHEELTRLQKDKKNKEKERKANTESTETLNNAPADSMQANQPKLQTIQAKGELAERINQAIINFEQSAEYLIGERSTPLKNVLAWLKEEGFDLRTQEVVKTLIKEHYGLRQKSK